MAQPNARDTGAPHVHYYRKTVTLGDFLNAGGTVLIGTLPAGAFPLQTFVRVEQAFNGTTPALTVGTNATVDNMVGAADATEGSLQTQIVNTGAGLSITADTDVFAKFVGAGATTGQATIAVGYLPNH